MPRDARYSGKMAALTDGLCILFTQLEYEKLKGKIIEFVNSGVECLKSRTGVNDQRVSRFCRHRSHSGLVTWNQEYEKL